MSSIHIDIDRRINDSQSDFRFLFGLFNRYGEVKNSDIYFNFIGCGFLRQNAVALLGALVRILHQNQNQVFFDLDTIKAPIRVNLEQNGFLLQLGVGESSWDGNSIPYREDNFRLEDDYASYLSEKWLGKGWINISDNLRNYIVNQVIEAYINVFDHAESPLGVITCGQHFPRLRELKITMVDVGLGIPHTVREFVNQPDAKAKEALKWAFTPMKSSKHTQVARGNGLKLLKSFIQDNHGKLEIYSETGYACIDEMGEKYIERSQSFQGTIVQISLTCDETRYTLPNEEDYDTNEWFI